MFMFIPYSVMLMYADKYVSVCVRAHVVYVLCICIGKRPILILKNYYK